MWYFGCLLYQLCTEDGATIWQQNQADNINAEQMQLLANHWPSVKGEKLREIAWPQVRFQIIRMHHARIYNVGKSQSCMVSKLPHAWFLNYRRPVTWCTGYCKRTRSTALNRGQMCCGTLSSRKKTRITGSS